MGVFVDNEEVGYVIVEKNDNLQKIIDKSIVTVTYDDLSGLSNIGDYIFLDCENLQSVFIPYGITSIGIRAFDGCSNLTNIIIPDGIVNIGENAFYSCYNISSIEIPDSIEYVGRHALSDINDNAFTKIDNIKYIGNDNNPYLIAVGRINNTSSSETIKEGCKVVQGSFGNSSNITGIVIPDSVVSLCSECFYGKRNLISVTFGENSQLKLIDRASFMMTGITKIEIPALVEEIGIQAFFDSDLTEVIFKGQAPAFNNINVFPAVEKYDFRNCYKVPILSGSSYINRANGCQMIIPDELYDEWTTTTNWVSLTDVNYVKASEVNDD